MAEGHPIRHSHRLHSGTFGVGGAYIGVAADSVAVDGLAPGRIGHKGHTAGAPIHYMEVRLSRSPHFAT